MNQTPQIPDRPTDGRRLHVLMCAVACHPDVGSEYAVGWQWVQRVAAIHDLTVVTADSRGSRAAIEAYRAQNPAFAAAATFVFLSPFDTPPSLWVRKMRRMIPIFYYRAYRQWLREAADTARGIIASRHVDLVHQTTFITFREPGVLCRLGRPFVWGPVGGNQCVPVAFLPGLGLVDGLRNTARNVINWLQFNGKRDVGYAKGDSEALRSRQHGHPRHGMRHRRSPRDALLIVALDSIHLHRRPHRHQGPTAGFTLAGDDAGP
jgi:hypothetical protein